MHSKTKEFFYSPIENCFTYDMYRHIAINTKLSNYTTISWSPPRAYNRVHLMVSPNNIQLGTNTPACFIPIG